MSAQIRRFLCAAILGASLYPAPALVTVVPVLTNATCSGNQFQFTLLGETNVSYIIQSSSNLYHWTAVVTNSDAQATRTITVPALSAQTFWRVRPVPSPLFEYAILVRDSVILSTNGGRIDSFNSTNALESGPGGVYDPARATARAMVATTSRATNALSVGNMSIYGSVQTGPGGTVTLDPGGNVGSTAFNDNPAYNGIIEPGHSRDDLNVYIPDGRLPFPYGPILPMAPGFIGPGPVTNYNYVLGNGDYRAVALSGGQRIAVVGKARIHVLGQTRTSSSAIIYIAPGASLELYAGGDVDLAGQGVWNYPGEAKNFSVIGMNTCTSVRYSGGWKLCGTIYAPYANVNLVGNSEAFGAFVGKTFSVIGTMDLHFDESLKSAGPFR